jgi:hypothetical protein
MTFTNNDTKQFGQSVIQAVEDIDLVADAKYFYRLSNKRGNRLAERRDRKNASQLVAYGGPELFQMLKAQGELKVRPPQREKGKELQVLEAVSPTGGFWSCYFDPDTGLMVKTITADESLGVKGTVALEDPQFNVAFPPDYFDFVLPDDVLMYDYAQDADLPEGVTPVDIELPSPE